MLLLNPLKMSLLNYVRTTASNDVFEDQDEEPPVPLYPATTRRIPAEHDGPRFQFLFLDLPYDIRRAIYEHLMPKLPSLDIRSHTARDRFHEYGSLTPGLLRANKQTCLEYSRIMYDSSTFILTEARDFYYFLMFTSRGCLAHVRSISVASPCVRYSDQAHPHDFSAWDRAWTVVGDQMEQLRRVKLVVYSSLYGCQIGEELLILEPLKRLRGLDMLSIEDHGTRNGERGLKLRSLASSKEDMASVVKAEEDLNRLVRLPRSIG